MVTSPRAPGGTAAGGSPADAGDPVLLSKITTPGVPGWAVPRPRIEAIMAESARVPLITVTGPPGAGKTMSHRAVGVRPDERGPVRLDDGGRVRQPARGVLVLRDGRPAGDRRAVTPCPPPRMAGRRAARPARFPAPARVELAGQDPPVDLVLDDLHLLTAPAALDGLAYVLRNAAPGLRLIAGSRMDPLLPLHRYRAAGELAEIRAGQLAFSVAETTLLLAQHGIVLPDSDVQVLTRRAEGWAAGLRLAAISLEGHPDPAQFVKEFAAEDSSITGYLVEEVLDAQSPGPRPPAAHQHPVPGQRRHRRRAHRRPGRRERAAGTRPHERVRAGRQPRRLPLPPPVRLGAAPEAPPREPGPGAGPAPAGGPVVLAPGITGRGDPARRRLG